MNIADILDLVKSTQGTNAKMDLLRKHKDNELFKKALKYALDGFINFNVVKVVKTKERLELSSDENQWANFFDLADACASRVYTGNAAIAVLSKHFKSVNENAEKWMRKVLEKNFSIGIATKSINKIFPGLIRTFEVQLAEKWTDKSSKSFPKQIRIEPKLDGIRCLSFVNERQCQMFARSGKQIVNFDDTIGKELATLPSNVYDGEIMDTDFTALMRQVHRKEGTDTTQSYLTIFDVVCHEEWDTQDSVEQFSERRKKLVEIFKDKNFKYLRLVDQSVIQNSQDQIDSKHEHYVLQGYEGAMVKNPNAPYCFGRSDAVVKVKAFDDDDLRVIGFKEGTGKHVGKLGSLLVDFNGVEVNVGSGLDDEMREEVWNNKDKYLGKVCTVKSQERTPDGSLRFPTFVCWRHDRS